MLQQRAYSPLFFLCAMNILEKYVSAEITVKNSRFLSELFPCDEQGKARAIIREQKAKYADAKHVVHAFIIGLGAEIMGMSDDGEPSGTAGRPVLDVVKGRNCTNLVLTVTRWFGGILLGTGGLVKAYGDSAKLVLDTAAEQHAVTEYIEKRRFSLSAGYSDYQIVKHIFSQFTISGLQEEFGTEIHVSACIPKAEYEILEKRIQDSTNGRVRLA